MKNIIKELENKKYACYQELMAGTIRVKEYLSKVEEIDKDIELAKKAENWVKQPQEKRRPSPHKRFNWLKFSSIVVLIFICCSFIIANATTITKNTQVFEKPIVSESILQEVKIEENCINSELTSETEWVSLGTFITSGYCNEPYYHMCNDGTPDTTATMTTPTAGRTIAVDPSVIPYGSEVQINGHVYIAEDCGSAIKGKRIDILYDNHDVAFAHGMQEVEVFIKINN